MNIEILDENKIVSVGYDRKPIVWKISEETSMVYTKRGFSLDCLTVLNKHHFITGGEDGEICVWNVSKKKPRLVLTEEHKGGWISSL